MVLLLEISTPFKVQAEWPRMDVIVLTLVLKRAGALYTTRVPLGSIVSAFCIVLTTLNKRAYARCEMYAQLPGVKPTDVPD